MKKPPIPTFVAAIPEPGKSKTTLFVVLGIVALAIGFGLYFYIKKRRENEESDED